MTELALGTFAKCSIGEKSGLVRQYLADNGNVGLPYIYRTYHPFWPSELSNMVFGNQNIMWIDLYALVWRMKSRIGRVQEGVTAGRCR